MSIKKQIEYLQKKKDTLQTQIRKYKIDFITQEELNTWNEKKLKEINAKIQLHISKDIFKSQLQENSGLETETWASSLSNILNCNSRGEFFKLIEGLPENIKTALGYINIKKAKRDFKPKPKSYLKKQQLKTSKSVRLLYTPMGNKR